MKIVEITILLFTLFGRVSLAVNEQIKRARDNDKPLYANEDLQILMDHDAPQSDYSFKSIAGTTPDWIDRFRCREIKSSHHTTTSLRTTCCLQEDGDHSKIKCLPSFIIGGTQKSGTTALSAYLATHPQVSFPTRKEVHYFSDGKKRKDLKIEDYFKAFQRWNYTSVEFKRSPRINGEATPYYLASRLSCKKISQTLPHVKFIVLMREPVSRAYSEYQMKKRRVEAQDAFIALLHNHAAQTRKCLLVAQDQPPGLARWKFIAECVPSELSLHGNWPKLRLALTAKLQSGAVEWESAIDTCFPIITGKEPLLAEAARREEENSEESKAMAPRSSGSSTLARLRRRRHSPPLPSKSRRQSSERRLLEDHSWRHYDASDWGYTNDSYRYNMLGVFPPSVNSSSIESSKWELRTRILREEEEAEGDAEEEKTAELSPGDRPRRRGATRVSFRPIVCLEKHARERLLEPTAAFHDELERFKHCAGDLLSGGLEGLDRAVEKCITIRVGIADNYFYRSLYAVQLYNCFKYLPRSNFLLLPSERLQREPLQTVAKVLSFLGIPMHSSVLQLASRQNKGSSLQAKYAAVNASFISEAVRRHFPKFEIATGWAPVGKYEPLDDGLVVELHNFFSPYNRLLFEYIGEDWAADWAKRDSSGAVE